MKIRFTTDNAAFEENGPVLAEFKQIFDAILVAIENGDSYGRIYDSNGNHIGQWED